MTEEDSAYIQAQIRALKDLLGLKQKELENLDKEDRAKVLAFYDPKDGPLSYSNPDIESRFLALALLTQEIDSKIEAVYEQLERPQIPTALLCRQAEELLNDYKERIDKI